MKVNFQIIHSFGNNMNLKESLLSFLKETFNESTTSTMEIEEKPDNIEEWSIFDLVEIKYNYFSENNKHIAGLNLEVPEDNVAMISEFSQKIQDDDNIYLVLKYNDEVIQLNHQMYSKEIFDLEMILREVISFIFLDTYKKDFYNLLKDIDLKTQPLNGNNRPDDEYFKKHFENEFFFLGFSHYVRLNNLNELKKQDSLLEMIKNSNTYKDLKHKLQNRGIVKKNYQDFLAGIKDKMDPIEVLRNCIAHNRSFTETIVNNYLKAKENLECDINEFWDEVKNEN